jgi:hypothetical protein
MITHETTHYEDFTIKTFTERTDDVVTTYEEYNIKGQKISSVKGEFIEKWEYSRNRLRRYSNNNGYWKRYTYKADEIIVLANNGHSISKRVYDKNDDNDESDLIDFFEIPKKRKCFQTTIQF